MDFREVIIKSVNIHEWLGVVPMMGKKYINKVSTCTEMIHRSPGPHKLLAMNLNTFRGNENYFSSGVTWNLFNWHNKSVL